MLVLSEEDAAPLKHLLGAKSKAIVDKIVCEVFKQLHAPLDKRVAIDQSLEQALSLATADAYAARDDDGERSVVTLTHPFCLSSARHCTCRFACSSLRRCVPRQAMCCQRRFTRHLARCCATWCERTPASGATVPLCGSRRCRDWSTSTGASTSRRPATRRRKCPCPPFSCA